MSIINPELPGARILDLFAGSGALGLEALSRGAAHVDFVDNHPASLAIVRRNAEQLGTEDFATHRADAVAFARRLQSSAYDVAFADPPYRKGMAQALAEQWLATPFAHVFGVEHDLHDPMPDGGETRRYGSTAITFYRTDA